MLTVILIIIFVFALIVGGMMTLLKNKEFKLPDNYDRSKSGWDDDDQDKPSGF